MTRQFRPNLTPTCARMAAAIATSLLLALAGCGGGDAADSRQGFEPITCSAQPSPCA